MANISPNQKVHMYVEYHSVCLFVGIGTHPSPASECAPPPGTKGGGGAHSPAGEGVGESQFQ
jgi:hypothetical protein